MSALSGGVFATATKEEDGAELRQLVDDIGRKSFDDRLGRRRMPEQFDAELWRTLQDAGLTRLTSTPDLDAGPYELAMVLYGVARHAGAVPLAETDALAGWLAEQAGIDVPDGPLTVAVVDTAVVDTAVVDTAVADTAVADTAVADTAVADTAVADADGRVTGTAIDVPWTRAAAVVLAVHGDDALRVGLLDVDQATIVDGHNLAGEPRDRVTFDVAAADLTTVDSSLATELRCRGAWSRCMQIVGVLDAAAAMSVTHTGDRVQFGRPLSAFQSVQHALATMAGEIERARAAASLAVAAAADHGFDSRQTDYAVTVAKVAVGSAAEQVTTIAHQLHGAIGVTAEHPLWSATMRAQSWARDFGTTEHHARRLGRMALAAPDPWDLIIGNLTEHEIS